MDTKKQITPKIFNRIVIILGTILILLLVFQAGIAIGSRRAMFFANKNGNYMREFRDPQSILSPFLRRDTDINPHGTVGEIVSIKMPEIMLRSGGDEESIVYITATTSVRNLSGTVSSTTLKVNDRIVVIGEPLENGSISATFIRILPDQPPIPGVDGPAMRGRPSGLSATSSLND